MDVDYEMPVKDKNGKPLGTVDRIILDTWSGEPRKYVIRRDDETIFFTPAQVAAVEKGSVTLNLTEDGLERT